MKRSLLLLPLGAALVFALGVGYHFAGAAHKPAVAKVEGCACGTGAPQAPKLESEPALKKAFNSSEYVLNWTNTLASRGYDVISTDARVYTRDKVQVVSAPIKARGEELQPTWLQFLKGPNDKEVVWTITLLGNGKVAFRDLSGQGLDVQLSKDKKKPPVVSITEAGPSSDNSPAIAQTVSFGSYWRCVGNCLSNSWYSLPWWLQWACGGACWDCLFGTHNPYSCAGCAGCMGSYAGWCLWVCRGA